MKINKNLVLTKVVQTDKKKDFSNICINTTIANGIILRSLRFC